MREVIEQRPEHDQGGARPAALSRLLGGRAEMLVLAVAVALGQLAGDLPRFRRFGTGYNYDHWPELLAGLARRL